MASTTMSPIEEPTIDTKSAAGPKKRRRRTAATGATDDCFACRKRSAKCDRKRPYCTQCIDMGKECSGYKTTLTWGVGVASRGKLRGLTCPVANKNIDGSNASPKEMEARRRKSSVSKVKKESTSKGSSGIMSSMQGQSSGPTSMPNSTHAQTYPPPSLPIPVPQTQAGWQVPGYQEHTEMRNSNTGRAPSLSHPVLQRLQTSLGGQFDGGGYPHSANSMGSYTESSFHSPTEFPHTPDSVPFSESYPSYLSNPYTDQPMSGSSTDDISLNSASVDSYADTMSSSVGSDQSNSGFQDNATMDPTQADLSSFNNVMFGSSDMIFGPMRDESLMFDGFESREDQFQDDDMDTNRKDLALLDTRGVFNTTFFHLSPRLQNLLDYYDKNICPFLVAFDSPQNPYRMHVLNLAGHNEGLQNAIAALATNNMRMRNRKEMQRIGFVEELHDTVDTVIKDESEPSPEESCYKSMSIDQLNMQLVDPRSAQDDSVLATLLILCLFHVCDSGFSKFKTQLAGVQKLLSLRNQSLQSGFIGWVEMFFTWFDVMTSTVNDRETQIKGDSLDMLDFSVNLGALEQFSGCDGRLFKLIARLGRLNLLAQNRPVRATDGEEPTPKPSPQQYATKRPIRATKGKPKRSLNKILSALDYENLDGNGWGSPIISSDEESTTADCNDKETPWLDGRHEFWAEWQDIRSRLQAWEMDMTSIPSPSPVPAGTVQLGPEQRDLLHISESFRYSALLYTERLAHPLLPSSSLNFQNLVSQALYHITALPVTSCVNKFLLWPLFITGTECVDEGHRNVIRTRCIEIQKESGFFNNLSGLEVLERVWKEVGRGGDVEEVKSRRRDSKAGYGQAFRWRKAMDRVDGEYIVI